MDPVNFWHPGFHWKLPLLGGCTHCAPAATIISMCPITVKYTILEYIEVYEIYIKVYCISVQVSAGIISMRPITAIYPAVNQTKKH